MEVLSSRKQRRGIGLDPRTTIVLLLMVAVFVLGGAGGNELIWARIILACVPVVLLLTSNNKLKCIVFVLVYLLGYFLQFYVLGHLTGILNSLMLATAGMITSFLPGLMMGYYAVSTTTVSEFVAAMERIHMPEQVIIPLSVMFRFFPTVVEEAGSINDAMRMRGITMGGKHTGKMLEYRLIPIMTCSVKIGEELSAASLTRGLGAPVKRTNICKIGFGLWDILFLGLSICIVIYWVLILIGVRV